MRGTWGRASPCQPRFVLAPSVGGRLRLHRPLSPESAAGGVAMERSQGGRAGLGDNEAVERKRARPSWGRQGSPGLAKGLRGGPARPGSCGHGPRAGGRRAGLSAEPSTVSLRVRKPGPFWKFRHRVRRGASAAVHARVQAGGAGGHVRAPAPLPKGAPLFERRRAVSAPRPRRGLRGPWGARRARELGEAGPRRADRQ
ncbi:collagen alpha-1(I) chain-like [Vulpes lagopus]|uniref:collagen alpha-1(I) chain-like n=1 Tax=Vulpes lagopus TaxID=494514 RepID=UPI001BC9E744|nr:collagen alpha-1(I) chain-like [Vulpes lagopus]XP_041580308.1 collagen alpha-1(I) chain-like [Vulpes lagopus]XP_041580309.1 collagen alpha-1(I) chain-like [Vulpes lagopus]XP_041580310.1 collagen alpha-1(I) chain-like [Vulpes lagopus]